MSESLFYFSGVSYNVDTTHIKADDLAKLQVDASNDTGRADFLEILKKYGNPYKVVDDSTLPDPYGGRKVRGIPSNLELGDIESLIAAVRQLIAETSAELRKTLLEQGFADLSEADSEARANYVLAKQAADDEFAAGEANVAAQMTNAALSLAGAAWGAFGDLKNAAKYAMKSEKEVAFSKEETRNLEISKKNYEALSKGTHHGKFRGDEKFETKMAKTEAELKKIGDRETKLRKQLRNIEKKISQHRPWKEDIDSPEFKSAKDEYEGVSKRLREIKDKLKHNADVLKDQKYNLKQNRFDRENAGAGDLPTLKKERKEILQEISKTRQIIGRQKLMKADLENELKEKQDALPTGEAPTKSRAQIRKLEKELHAKKVDKAAIDEEIKRLDADIKGIHATKKMLADQAALPDSELPKLKADRAQAEALLKKEGELKRNRDALQKKSDETQREIETLDTAIKRPRNHVKAAEARRDVHVREAEKSIDDDNAAIKKIDGEIAKTKNDITGIEANIKTRQGRKDTLVAERGTLEQEQARVDQNIASIENKLKADAEIDNQIAQLKQNRNLVNLRRELNSTDEELGHGPQDKMRRAELANERQTLDAEDAKISRDIASLNGRKLSTLDKDSLDRQLDWSTRNKASIEGKITAKDGEIRVADNDLAHANKELGDKQDRLAAQQKDRDHLASRVAATKTSIAQDTGRTQLQKRIEKVEAREQELETDLRKLKGEIDRGHASQKQALDKAEHDFKESERKIKESDERKHKYDEKARKHLEKAGLRRATFSAFGQMGQSGGDAYANARKYDANKTHALEQFQQAQLENLYKRYDLLMEVAGTLKDLRDGIVRWASDLNSQVQQAAQKAMTA